MPSQTYSNDALRIVQYARMLLARPNGWCQEAVARDKDSHKVYAATTSAVSFDIHGAVLKAEFDLGIDDLLPAQQVCHAIWAVIKQHPKGWNDHEGRTQDEVLAMFDQVIQNITQLNAVNGV